MHGGCSTSLGSQSWPGHARSNDLQSYAPARLGKPQAKTIRNELIAAWRPQPAKTQPAPRGAGCPLPPESPLGTCVENGDRAPVLRPAGNVVAHRDRPLLAVGDRAHALLP